MLLLFTTTAALLPLLLAEEEDDDDEEEETLKALVVVALTLAVDDAAKNMFFIQLFASREREREIKSLIKIFSFPAGFSDLPPRARDCVRVVRITL